MITRSVLSFVLVLAVALFGVRPAFADIYTFKDERGVVHFTNIKGLDPRYKLLRREGESPVPGSGNAARVYMPSQADIQRYSSIVEKAARIYGVDKALVHAVISAESGYNPQAVSRTGARGLMQLMPETARRYGVADPFDPEENVRAGVRHLKELLAQFDGDVELAIAAYNAGPGAVVRAGNRVPPYPETERYVPRVMGRYHRLRLAERGPRA